MARKKTVYKKKSVDPNKPVRPFAYEKVHIALRLLKDQTPTQLARQTYLCAGTFRKLRIAPKDGGTRWPRADTVDEMYRIAGMKLVPVPIDSADVVQLPRSRRNDQPKIISLPAVQQRRVVSR